MSIIGSSETDTQTTNAETTQEKTPGAMDTPDAKTTTTPTPGEPVETQSTTPTGDVGNGNLYDQIKGANIKDIVPEQYKDNPYLTRVNDIDTLIKNYVEAQQFISQSVRLPGDNSTEQEVSEFYKKLGKPEKIDDYPVEFKEEYKQKGLEISQDTVSWFKELSHKNNLTTEQASNFFNEYMEQQVKLEEAAILNAQEQRDKTIDELKGKWRSKYQDNINLINSKLDTIFPKEVQATLGSKGMLSDKGFIEAMLVLTKTMSGDNLFVEGSTSDGYKSDLQKLELKRNELMRAPDRRQRHKEEYELNKQILELKQKLNPSGER